MSRRVIFRATHNGDIVLDVPIERFLETGRKLGTNQSMEDFERTFRKLVQGKRATPAAKIC
jgi:hypothetical protein